MDLVDVNQAFLDEAKTYLGPDVARVERFICSSLHQFTPEPKRYDVIWCQWVLGHLTNDDLVRFFERCRTGLTDNGLIFVKENMCSGQEPDFDEQDSSWTRPRTLLLQLFKEAGLHVLREQKQKSFPKELYEVRMFALK